MCSGAKEAAVRELMCVCIHYYFVPSYTSRGAWLLLGVRASNVQKADDTLTETLATPVML